VSLLNDLKILYHLALGPIRGNTHKERLESFYAGQAGAYDAFRKRLLHGREALYRAVPLAAGVPRVWIDMGGGTGANLEAAAHRLHQFDRVYIVDLSTSLLAVARDRIKQHGWANVEAVEADVTTFTPPGGAAGIITFSYSLTMIPDWFRAIDQARRLLAPGGHIGVVDFFVARKYPAEGTPRHEWWRRTLWPIWFGTDNVFLNPDHVPYLMSRFETVRFRGRLAPVPYVPALRVPFYQFIGRRPAD
jgi:S-adenosylmethionine-diacylgycerolhomoserine-N-methlytransferase